MKRIEKLRRQAFNIKELNSVLAYAASLVLSGVPPAVCESVLDELYSSVKKSVHKITA